jgi:hypothetical protein
VCPFPPLGGQPSRAAYRHLAHHHDVDAIVLVDGGTDLLCRGDESALGTPVEDLTSVRSARPEPGTPVDQFADQIQVAGVPRGLLDHVQDDPPKVGDLRRENTVGMTADRHRVDQSGARSLRETPPPGTPTSSANSSTARSVGRSAAGRPGAAGRCRGSFP